ncbi:MAG: lipid-binding protein [Bacteroidales bacterium]|jgi:hypothetical protein
MKKILIIGFTLLLGIMMSCDKMKDPKVDYVNLGKYLPGEWWVTYTVDGVDIYDMGHTVLTTSNTAANTSTDMWVTDNGNFWTFQVKATADPGNYTFSVIDGTDIMYDDTTTITNGRVFIDGGISKAGNVTDSIYMEIKWASDPGTIYVCSGVRRTGFLDDEY